jgi:diguanylate cyclase (GGDEF)-like protein
MEGVEAATAPASSPGASKLVLAMLAPLLTGLLVALLDRGAAPWAALACSLAVSVWLAQQLRRARREQGYEAASLVLRAFQVPAGDLVCSDGLTGLPNRRSLEETLRREWARAERNGSPLAVAIVGVDPPGIEDGQHDRVSIAGSLCLVAEALGQAVRRPSDVVARYGGGEFAVVLPETDLAGAATIAERLRAAVAAARSPHGNALRQPAVTVSAGVAVRMAGVHADGPALLAAAEDLMRRARRQGGDHVEVYDSAVTV